MDNVRKKKNPRNRIVTESNSGGKFHNRRGRWKRRDDFVEDNIAS